MSQCLARQDTVMNLAPPRRHVWEHLIYRTADDLCGLPQLKIGQEPARHGQKTHPIIEHGDGIRACSVMPRIASTQETYSRFRLGRKAEAIEPCKKFLGERRKLGLSAREPADVAGVEFLHETIKP